MTESCLILKKSELFLQTVKSILSKSHDNKILKHSISETRKCELSEGTNPRLRQFFFVLSRLLSSVTRVPIGNNKNKQYSMKSVFFTLFSFQIHQDWAAKNAYWENSAILSRIFCMDVRFCAGKRTEQMMHKWFITCLQF